MISHEHRLIFIHIPKCAGTSIERRFGHFDGFSGRHGQDHRPMRMIEAPAPLLRALASREDAKLLLKRTILPWRKAANPRNKLTVSPEQFRSYYKFTVIRDPWTRIYSWYRNVVKDPIHCREQGVTPDISLDAFVERFAGRGMIAPLDWWLRCYDGKQRLDRIVHFDSLQSDFSAVLRDLGLPEEPLARHHDGGGAVDPARVYSARARDMIGRIYGDEIARHGFRFAGAA